MALTIEMHDPAGTILCEIATGYSQHSVALTYAFCIAQGHKDFGGINAAICKRWRGKTALERIKRMAWKQVDVWWGKR